MYNYLFRDDKNQIFLLKIEEKLLFVVGNFVDFTNNTDGNRMTSSVNERLSSVNERVM